MVGPLPPYDLAAFGLRAYSHRVLDIRVLGGEHAALRPRTLIVCAHRSDLDVPVFAGFLYFAHGNWRRRRLLPHFAVRDDLFLRGFFAGYPSWRSPHVRSIAWPLAVGGALGRLRCRRIRSASRMRLAELFRALPDVPVAELVPAETAARLDARGIDVSRPSREALR